MTTGAHDIPPQVEVSPVKQSDHDHELDRLHADLNTKAHAAANRAEGIAMAANHTAASTAMAIGERVAVLEDARRTVDGDLKEIKATLDGIKTSIGTLTARSRTDVFLGRARDLIAIFGFGSIGAWAALQLIAARAGQ